MQVPELKDILSAAERQLVTTKTLDLSHNDLNSTPCIQEVITWLFKHKPSTVLLADCNFSDAAASAFAKYFRDDTSVLRISMRENNITDIGVRDWIQTLRKNKTIQSVDFLGNKLGSSAQELIDEFMSSTTCRSVCGLNSHIHGITLETMTSSDASLMAANLEKNTDLRSIEIFGNADAGGVESLLNALSMNRTLVRLKIVKFATTAPVLAALFRALSKNLSLKSLEISFDPDVAELREGRAVNEFFDSIEGGRSLTCVRLENLPSSSIVDNLCARLIQNHRSLLHLSLFNYKPAANAVDLLCRGLAANQSLRLLRLGGDDVINLTAEDYREIGDAAMDRQVSYPFLVRVEGQEDRYFTPATVDPEHARTIEWEIDDFVELKVHRNSWVPAQVIALLGAGEYAIIRADGEVQSNVAAEDIRKGVIFHHARGARDSIVAPVTADAHRRYGISAPVSSSTRTSTTAFVPGESVEVRFYGDPVWYAGRIQDAASTGIVDVVLEDGTLEQQLEPHMVRRPSPLLTPSASSYDVGMYVRGDYVYAKVPKNQGVWARARVASDKKNGTYDVRLEDQTDEKGLAGRHMKHYFRVDDVIDARRSKSLLWERAKIIKVDKDGTYQVLFETGDDSETGVTGRRIMASNREQIRAQAIATNEKERDSAAPAVAVKAPKFAVNDRVEVLVNGDWTEARVITQGKTYGLRIIDGGQVDNIAESNIRPLSKTTRAINAAAAVAGGSDSNSGAMVPVRPSAPAPSSTSKERSRKSRDRADSSDGDAQSSSVEVKLKKTASSTLETSEATSDSPKKKSKRRQSTSSVDKSANGEKSREGPSEAVSSSAEGTSVKKKSKRNQPSSGEEKSDAEVTGSVVVEKVDGGKPVNGAIDGPKVNSVPVSVTTPSFKRGDRIEASYQGISEYFLGMIAGVGDVGCFDILYDDGTFEKNLPSMYIRNSDVPMPSFRAPIRAPDTTQSSYGDEQPKGGLVFDQLSRSWRPASILKLNHNGSVRIRLELTNEECDVDYSDISFDGRNPSASVPRSDSRRPSSAGPSSIGTPRDPQREGIRPHSSVGYPQAAASLGGDSNWRYSQSADSGRGRYSDEYSTRPPGRESNPMQDLPYVNSTPVRPSSTPGTRRPLPGMHGLGNQDQGALFTSFVSTEPDNSSQMATSTRWSQNGVLDQALGGKRVMPLSGTGFGVFHSSFVREGSWNPLLAYVFDIQTQAMLDTALASSDSFEGYQSPHQSPIHFPPASEARTARPGTGGVPNDNATVPGAFLIPDTDVSIVPSSEWLTFGPDGKSVGRVNWDGEKVSCPLFMSLRGMPPHGTPIEAKINFYVSGVIVSVVTIEVQATAAKGRTSRSATPNAPKFADIRVPMFRSIFIINTNLYAKESTAGKQKSYVADQLLSSAIRNLSSVTIRTPDRSDQIMSSYIRAADHIQILNVESTDLSESVRREIQFVLHLLPTDIERTQKISYSYANINKSEVALLKELPELNSSLNPSAAVENWVLQSSGLKRHLRNKLAFSASAISRLILDHCREERSLPIGVLLLPLPASSFLDSISLNSALDKFQPEAQGEAELYGKIGEELVNATWQIRFFCEDFTFQSLNEESVHEPIDCLPSSVFFLDAYPLLKLTITMLIYMKVSQANNVELPSALNTLSFASKLSIHSLISLSSFYDQMEIYFREFATVPPASRQAGISSLRSPNGKLMISAAPAAVSEEVEYEDMELLAITAAGCESAIANIVLHGGLGKLCALVRSRLEELCPSWLALSGMRVFVIDETTRWISGAAFKRSWKALFSLLNPSSSLDEVESLIEDSEDTVEALPAIVRDPVDEICAQIKLGLRIKDDSIASATAKCLTKEGCESWEDVLNLVEFVGGASDSGNSFQAVNKFLLAAGVPVVAAGKLVAFLKQHSTASQ